MIDLFENSNFGRFDASHFGMWLQIDRALNAPDYQALGGLMWSTFHFPISSDHASYVAHLNDPDQRIFAATCFTVYAHEARHFHDLLATPYGAMLMRQYTRAALFYMFLWDECYFRRDAIVVPLSDWVENDAAFRQVYSDLQPASEIILETELIFRTMVEKLGVFDRGWCNATHARFPTASSILEGSAVIAQQRAIGSHFGGPAAEGYLEKLWESRAADNYLGALSLLGDMTGGQASAQVISYLLLACLYGNFQDPTPKPRYPSDVLIQLAVWLRESRIDVGNVSSFDDLEDVIDRYFRAKLGGPSAI